jgi:hypothetical protein
MFATVPKNEESTFTQMAHFWTLSERANLSQCHNFDQVQETKLGPKRPIYSNSLAYTCLIIARPSLYQKIKGSYK